MGAAEDGRAPAEELAPVRSTLASDRKRQRLRRYKPLFDDGSPQAKPAVCRRKLIGNRKSIATLLIDLYFAFEPLLVTL